MKPALFGLLLLSAGVTASEPASPVLEADAPGAFAFTRDLVTEAYPDVGYDQPLRPQFHFSSRRNWLNDPNGMVYHDGAYHLFFQHNPQGLPWGNMTWGHATSPDMVHWSQHNHALMPYRVDQRDGTIYSGTAIVDHHNSLGVQVGDTKTLCAFYTFAAGPKFYQALAYSTDGGEIWDYWNEGRPVVDNQGFDNEERDPKVFWHEETGRWVMFLWVELKPGRVRVFTSENLTDWRFATDLMRDWAFECVDVFPAEVDGDPSQTKWVFYDASFDYEVGTFDGETFHTEAGPFVQGGGDFYAAQTFNHAPGGRDVQIGWMRRGVWGERFAQRHGLPFNQQMSFPCELTLRSTPQGPRLFVWPVEEIDEIVTVSHTVEDLRLTGDADGFAGLPELGLVDLEIAFDPGTAERVVFKLPNVELTYHTASGELTHTATNDALEPYRQTTLDGLQPREGEVRLRLLVDRMSVEAYRFGGEHFNAHYLDPSVADGQQSLTAKGGVATVKRLTVRELGSAW